MVNQPTPKKQRKIQRAGIVLAKSAIALVPTGGVVDVDKEKDVYPRAEAVDLLKDYSEEVPEVDLLKYIKTRLFGPAHGVINTARTLAEAKTQLKAKSSIKFSLQAIKSEMTNLKQTKKSLSEYGQQINELAG